MKNSAKVIWFTGLSGSGKTTIAKELKKEYVLKGKRVEIIDGDVIRNTVNKKLGFSREDIKENNQIIAELCFNRRYDFDLILVPVISPYIEDRKMAKEIIGDDNFIELYISTPIEECIRRDIKGLYKKALNNEIDNMIGLSKKNTYEPPINPDFAIDTTDMSIDYIVSQIINFLESRSDIKIGRKR